MNILKKITALVLMIAMLFSVACSPSDGNTSGSEGNSIPNEPNGPVYNIIFALASIPPVLAALDSIDNGCETYAIIERGKTYSGIDSVEGFHNAGFDPANNLSNGFTSTEFDAMVAKVKELNESDENVFFNFYVQDGTALRGVAVAANAGLDRESFHIYMCEDGSGAYHALYDKFIEEQLAEGKNDEIYDNYADKVKEAEKTFNKIMGKSNNKNSDKDLAYNISLAFALAALDNFTYYLQDEEWIVDILKAGGDTRLLAAFGVEGYDADTKYTLNLKYQRISDGISKLTEKEKTDYLTLMYGQYYEDTYNALTRGERDGEAAPEKKLVFIGSRHGGYPKLASDPSYGIGGIQASESVPTTYAELDQKYKNALLFATEEDYNVFLERLNEEDNYAEDIPDELKEMAKVAVFNIYIDYIFTLKLTYSVYGENYDVIMKGHPREAIGCYEEWNNRYKFKYGDGGEYVYDKLLDSALMAFHQSDSVGKKIGMVPYGTAAENLAYLGADIAIAGLPSSTYSGFDTDVDVLFIIAETDEDISGSGNDEAVSQVKARYEAGNLIYTDGNGEKKETVFYNTGNVFKTASEVYSRLGDESMAEKYDTLFELWMDAAYGDTASDINEQGFPKK